MHLLLQKGMWMYNPRVGGKQDTFFPFTFVGAAAPTRLFLLVLCQRMAPMGSDSPIAGRVGKKHVSFRNLAGAPPPNPGSLFVRTKSDQKTAREEKPFRWGFSPVTPSSATTQRGAPAPLWKPPHNLRSLCSTVEAPRRDCWGENPKRGPQPPHWSLRGVVLRRGTQSKVSPS